MDWVDKPQNYKGKGLYGILQPLGGSHLNNFPLKTFTLGWIYFHSATFQLKCLDFRSTQYKKLVLVLSRFCNRLLHRRARQNKVRVHMNVGRVTVDLIRRSWVRIPPRSRDFFFTSCGSLIHNKVVTQVTSRENVATSE